MDGGAGGGPEMGDSSAGLDGPEDSLFQTLKPALVLVGILAFFFLMMVLLG